MFSVFSVELIMLKIIEILRIGFMAKHVTTQTSSILIRSSSIRGRKIRKLCLNSVAEPKILIC